MKIETIGKFIGAAYGDKVLVGIIIGFLKGVTPDRAYEYIKNNTNLLYWASDVDWQRFQRMAKGANIGDITRENVIKELRRHKPDILGVILNHPLGVSWLDTQIAELRKRLGI